MRKINMNIKTKVGGFYKLTTVDATTGKKTKETSWFPNLFTNYGLDFLGTTTPTLSYCHVGTGSTTPVATDTQLVGWLANTATRSTISQGARSESPYYIWRRTRYTFGEGVAEGTLAEVMVNQVSGNENAVSRALILDEFGAPTTIQVLSNEFLYVTYELRMYPPTTDLTGSVEIDGLMRNWTSRAASVTVYVANAAHIGWGFLAAHASRHGGAAYVYTVDSATYAAEDITTAAAAGTGSMAIYPTWVNAAYAIGSYERSVTATVDLVYGNGTWNILRIGFGWGVYRIHFDPEIVKDDTMRFIFTFKHSWARTS